MSASTLLLRVLLCLTLILNGSGVAFAATGMELAHLSDLRAQEPALAGAAHMDMSGASSTGQMPCHGEGQEPGMDRGPAPLAWEHSGNGPAPAEGDCCPSSHCACLQHLTATVPPWVIRPAVIAHAALIRAHVRDHPAPPAPSLIRPPIG